MGDRSAGATAGWGRRSRLLVALLAGSMATMASAACSGAAPATTTGVSAPTAVAPAASMPGSITWEIREAPGRRVTDAVSTEALLVAVGVADLTAESGDVAGAWTSPDGQAWEPASLPQPAGVMMAVTSGPGRLVAVGTVEDGTSGPAGWTSVDGRTWQRLPASAFAGSVGYAPGALEDVVAGPGGFVAVGSEVGAGGSRAAAWHSSDGLAWTRTTSNLGGDSAGAVVQFGSGYVAAGWSPGENGDDRALFWTSPDGRTWTAAPDAKDLHDVGSTPTLAAVAGHLVAFGGKSHAWAGNEPLVWTSQDGVTWQREASAGVVAPLPSVPPPASGEPALTTLGVGGLIGAGTGFVAGGTSLVLGNGPLTARRVVWTSSSGASWSIAADIPEANRGQKSDPGRVGPLVVHQGRLLVFGSPLGAGSAPLWETDLQGILHESR